MDRNSNYNIQRLNDAHAEFHRKHTELDIKYRVKRLLTAEEVAAANDPRFDTETEVETSPPIPVDSGQAFQLFKDYYGTWNLYKEQNLFFERYRSYSNRNAISDELKKMDAFIAEANAISYEEACKPRAYSTELVEFRRLSGGFYEEYRMDWDQHSMFSTAAVVYGRYMLFYQYLQQLLTNSNAHDKTNTAKQARLAAISSSFDLEHYKNPDVIPNQDLVSETITHFDGGPGKRVFSALELLNMLNKQAEYVKMNFTDTDHVLRYLRSLDLSALEQHVLFGFLIKWVGGYPIHNLDEEFNRTYGEIEKVFLSYPEDTPEKNCCKTDQARRNKMDMFGIALTTSINSGIPFEEVLKGMGYAEEPKKTFHSFDALFRFAVDKQIVTGIVDTRTLLIERSKHEHLFKIWLQTHKGWRYGDEAALDRSLRLANLQEYISATTAPDVLNGQQSEEVVVCNESTEVLLTTIGLSENRRWKGLPMSKVVLHFQVLTKQKNANNEYFLTEDNFIQFLKKGFGEETQLPKLTLKVGRGDKGLVILLFYQLFDLAATQFNFPSKKEPFIQLLTDCFDNWTKNEVVHFFKPGKTKRSW